ncbi:Trehalose synthase [Labilithrix luteola]|uniref:Trehalose synthase n=1 Tax=Labilithrix luteola TaxID=1391654 RepID=A0A0K1PVW7_9BACT|nr:glycosyltransferase [Labilithrix luteola]AKU97259.1 Trehalose synthase [Labilithrix luteola]
MFEEVEVKEPITLEAYDREAYLTSRVSELRAEAAKLVPRLGPRTVWMISSTSHGGGVAEMMPKLVSLLDEVGVPCRWGIIGADRAEFFALTKRIHNMIHGQASGPLDAHDRALFEGVNRRNADELAKHIAPGDVIVIHDPQPLGLGAFLRREHAVRVIFRSHIGIPTSPEPTREAWEFLRPYVEACDRSVFTFADYAPEYLKGHVTAMQPGIDPWSHKNRELRPHKLMGVLCNAGLQSATSPVLTPAFEHRVSRLDGASRTRPSDGCEDLGLLFRPIVTQISRWDFLKGWEPLLLAFARLKTRGSHMASADPRHARRIDLVRLILAGPDPSSIQDDPQAHEDLRSLLATYRTLPAEVRNDVAILTLPMHSRKENALIVNALQRCSTVVIQNSLEEGFGLTVTEAMWKRLPVIGTSASGLQRQIRNRVDGLVTNDPRDPDEIAHNLDVLLADEHMRDAMGSSGQRRVYDHSLVFNQIRAWLRLLTNAVAEPLAA